VVDLMISKLRQLPPATQEELKQLACLGDNAEIAALVMVNEGSAEELAAALWEAVRAGLVLKVSRLLQVPPRPDPGGRLRAHPGTRPPCGPLAYRSAAHVQTGR
jgi:hypothetical protein